MHFLPFILSGWIVACGADTFTTNQALQRGAQEGNPALSLASAWQIDAAVFSTCGLGMGGTAYLWKSGHKKTAIFISLGVMIAHGLAAEHNTHVNR